MNRQAFATRLDVELHILEVWIAREWLVPVPEPEPTFSDTDLARGRLIQDLETRLGVNDEGIDVILHLLDQLHGVRRAFADMHAELQRGRS